MTQMIIAGAIGLLVSIFITPWLIRKFSAVGIGQEIREEGPKSHLRKRGTPTMGGIAILIGITINLPTARAEVLYPCQFSKAHPECPPNPGASV